MLPLHAAWLLCSGAAATTCMFVLPRVKRTFDAARDHAKWALLLSFECVCLPISLQASTAMNLCCLSFGLSFSSLKKKPTVCRGTDWGAGVNATLAVRCRPIYCAHMARVARGRGERGSAGRVPVPGVSAERACSVTAFLTVCAVWEADLWTLGNNHAILSMYPHTLRLREGTRDHRAQTHRDARARTPHEPHCCRELPFCLWSKFVRVQPYTPPFAVARR